MSEFVPFPKIARWSREIIITEKIDGTNAGIYIDDRGIRAASRTRFVTPEADNFGFARWVQQNAEELMELGPGIHHGEWWGVGIQRGYDMHARKFSLFNCGRWNVENVPNCVSVVPMLYKGEMSERAVEQALIQLREQGSRAAPGYMKPEGIVIYHTHSNALFKKTLEKDDAGKGQNG